MPQLIKALKVKEEELDEVYEELKGLSISEKKRLIAFAKRRTRYLVENYSHIVIYMKFFNEYYSLDEIPEIFIIEGKEKLINVPVFYKIAIEKIEQGIRSRSRAKYPNISDLIVSVINSETSNCYDRIKRIIKRSDEQQPYTDQDAFDDSQDPLELIQMQEQLQELEDKKQRLQRWVYEREPQDNRLYQEAIDLLFDHESWDINQIATKLGVTTKWVAHCFSILEHGLNQINGDES
jgi:hypothetical protein